jgi:hypothetical protein
MTTKLIQDCYDILKDPLLIHKIFDIAFPDYLKEELPSTNL